MKKNIVLVCLLYGMLVCCTNNKSIKESPVNGVINLENALIEKKTFSYDSIISEISVIKFENSKSSFIYNPKRFIIDSNGDIYILNGNDNVLVFNADGNFLHHIGDRGKGPGEYLSASDICISKTWCYLHLVRQ